VREDQNHVDRRSWYCYSGSSYTKQWSFFFVTVSMNSPGEKKKDLTGYGQHGSTTVLGMEMLGRLLGIRMWWVLLFVGVVSAIMTKFWNLVCWM